MQTQTPNHDRHLRRRLEACIAPVVDRLLEAGDFEHETNVGSTPSSPSGGHSLWFRYEHGLVDPKRWGTMYTMVAALLAHRWALTVVSLRTCARPHPHAI